MDNAEVLHQLNVILVMVLYLSAPVLGVAAVVGLTVGLLQAVTQIQDQSLPQTLKLVAILLTIGLLGPLMAGSLVNATRDIFNEFPAIARSSNGVTGQ
jgi:type III secretion protein S